MSLTEQTPESIRQFIDRIEDPRTNTWLQVYSLEFLLLSALLAIMSGAQGFTAISLWAHSQRDWLSRLVTLPPTTPSHDTYSRLFSLLDASVVEESFIIWTQELAGRVQGFVALDGKTLRASRDPEHPAVHLLNAWASENAMVLGQMRVNDKENEIVGLPRLIEALDLQDCTITIDAMGCQVAIAQAIVDSGADYILRVKGNQGTLMTDLEDAFGSLLNPESRELEWEHTSWEEVDKGHGRLEIRKVWATNEIGMIASLDRWPEVESIICVKATRENLSTGKVSEQTRYYISSHRVERSEHLGELAMGIRNHWGIENKVHWVLDVGMNEDRCTSRKGSSAQMLSLVRKMTLNLYRKHKGVSAGAQTKMMLASNDKNYLLEVLTSS